MQQVSFGILLSKNWFRNSERVRDTNSTRGEIVCQGAPLPPDVASVCGRHNPLSLSLLLHCSKYSSNSNPRRLPWQLCNEHRAPCRLQSSSPVDGRAADAVLPPSCVVVVAVVVAAFYSLHSKTTAAKAELSASAQDTGTDALPQQQQHHIYTEPKSLKTLMFACLQKDSKTTSCLSGW